MKECICSHALQWERGSSKLLVTQPFATWGILNNTSVNTWALHRFRCNFKKNSLQARWQLKTRYYGNVSHTHTCSIMDTQMNIKNWVTTFDLSLGRPTYTVYLAWRCNTIRALSLLKPWIHQSFLVWLLIYKFHFAKTFIKTCTTKQ